MEDDEAPVDGQERTERAVKAMGAIGLKRQIVVKTLRRLYKVYQRGMWIHVEADDYSLLADETLTTQVKLDTRKQEAAADATSEIPKVCNDPAQVSSSTPAKVNSYPQRSATALKVLATRIIEEEEDAVRRKLNESTKQLHTVQKNSSLLHSRGGVTPRIDGRGVKLIDSLEINIARRPEDPVVDRKLKQLKQEVDSHRPTTARRLLASSPQKRLKRQHREEEARGSDPEEERKHKHDPKDVSAGFEAIPIPIVNHCNSKSLPPSFYYIDKSRPYEKAHVNLAISRIGDDDCCPDCYKDCLTAPYPCACARETGGEFAYNPDGCLQKRYIDQFQNKQDSSTWKKYYCESGFHCPEERHKNEDNPASCKGHFVRDFVKECSCKCGCSKQCGNRVVQRGINRRLEVFMTHEGKGWAIRTLEDLPVGAFVFEYVGEILTNTEMWKRNHDVHLTKGRGDHTYPMLLDGDWGSEANLKDEEALCLDATYYGNVARFLNHRCYDANLMDMPVEIDSPDRHYYHVAFFTNRQVKAREELTWDYGIDFEDKGHPIPAFDCLCGSGYCRGKKR